MNSYIDSLKNVIKAYSTKKPLDYENTNYWLARWPSLLITPVFLKIKVTANAVTWLSFLVGLFGIGCLAIPNQWVQASAFVLLYLAFLLDNIDGNIARTHKQTNHYGKFIDGCLGTSYQCWQLLAIGISLGYDANTKALDLPVVAYVAIGGAGTGAVLLQSYALLRLKAARQSLSLQRSRENEEAKKVADQYCKVITKGSLLQSHSIFSFLAKKVQIAWSKINRALAELEWPILLPAIFFGLDAYLVFYASVKFINLFVTYVIVLKSARNQLSYFRPF